MTNVYEITYMRSDLWFAVFSCTAESAAEAIKKTYLRKGPVQIIQVKRIKPSKEQKKK